MATFVRSSFLILSLIFSVLPASAGAIRSFSGFQPTTLAKDDDVSSAAVPLGFTINFFGRSASTVYVNTNGNITFDGPYSDYPGMPVDDQTGTVITGLAAVSHPIVGGFFADIDTSDPDPGAISYGTTSVNGRPAFVATYSSVTFYRWYVTGLASKHNSFQIIIIDRSDTGAGNFDIELNYDQVEWESSDSSGGTNGLGGYSAHVGYSNGSQLSGTFLELPGSDLPGSFLASGSKYLVTGSQNSGGVAGRYVLPVRNGGTTPTGPAVTGLSPSTAQAGGAGFTLTVNGSGFTSGATVLWNSAGLPTTFVSATQVTAQVSAGLIASAATASVAVSAGGTTSNASSFTISSASSLPTISGISPTAALAGTSAFTLTVNGSGFVAGATVVWNGTALPTSFVNANQLTASVSAGLIASAGSVTVAVSANGSTSNTASFTISTATSLPTITNLSPTSAQAGSAGFTLTVTGSGFVGGSTVMWNGAALPTSFVNASQLSASVASGLISTAGSATIAVIANGATSNTASFTITAGTSQPTISGINPSTAQAGGAAFTLTVNGSGFTAGSIAVWNGTALPTSFVNASQLTASVSATFIATAGAASVAVSTNGTTSNAANFTISSAGGGGTPTISSLSPAAAQAGGAAFTLTVNGSGFTAGSTVLWTGSPLPTTFVSATQLTAAVAANQIGSTGSALVSVNANGTASNSSIFTITAATTPTITTLNPSTLLASNQGFTLTVNGSGFTASSVVMWSGLPVSTTFVSATQLTAAIPANFINSLGVFTVAVSNGGVLSSGASFTVTAPVPTITSLSPPQTPAGGAGFTLTVNGSGFTAGSTVLWNGSGLPTVFVSASQLTASVGSGLIASQGAPSITVSASGGVSNSSTFIITAGATPVISSLNPSTIQAGNPAFTLTVNGSGFGPSSAVQWNGNTLPTAFVSTTSITATVNANLVLAVGTANITVNTGGVVSNGSTFTITAAAPPAISSLSPATAQAGGASFTLTVNGSNFAPGSVVLWNGATLSTSNGSATQLTASVPASQIVTAGTANVTVSASGVVSNASSFTITAVPAPAISSINPSTAQAGTAAFTLTVNGSNFAASSVVLWNGATLPTVYVSANQLTGSVTASQIATAGTVNVTVSASGVVSNASSFTISSAAPPAISSISPSTAQAGGAAFTLTVNGSGFSPSATVLWNNLLLPTTFVSATKLTASVTPSQIAIAGTVNVTVGVNGVISNASDFTITAAPGPAISSLSPTTAQAGGGAAFTLTVNGSNFSPTSLVLWNNTLLPTTFVSPTRLTASVAANLIAIAGTANVTVSTGSQVSNASAFTITGGTSPTISSLNPSTSQAGGAAFTLTVNGSNFGSNSTVQWNGAVLSTTFVSEAQLTASIGASQIASPGTASVTVNVNGVISNASDFTISAVPLPTISSLSPSTAQAGGAAFTLTVHGTNFSSNSTVQWNGAPLPTVFTNATQLTASVSAAQIATPGTTSVTVSANGVTSSASGFTITAAPTPAISGLAPSTAQAGGAAFTLTVNGSNFAASFTILWNGAAIPTAYVSATQLTGSVAASQIAAAGTANVTVSGNSLVSNASEFSITAAPAPAISSLAPSTAQAGGAAFTLTVNGSNFTAGSTVLWSDAPLATTFVSVSKLTASVAAGQIATVGTANVTVSANGVVSNASEFTITAAPAPAISGLAPSTAQAGGATFTLTVNGSNFTAGSTVLWSDAPLATTFVSASKLTASIAAAQIAAPGTAHVTVSANSVVSNAADFTITAAPAPAISGLTPSTAQASSAAFTLTVNGSNFGADSAVSWNGAALSTVFVSASQLTASVTAGLTAAAGTVNVTVSSNGGVSNASTFTITAVPPPAISSVSPSTAQAGAAAFTLTVNGSNFAPGSSIIWNGAALPTSFVSASQLSASVGASQITAAGAVSVTVSAGGVVSNSSTFTITPPPALAITSISPSSSQAGGPTFTLTVNGSGFTADSTVLWNSTPLQTTFVSGSQLTAPVSANLTVSPSSASISVILSNVTSNGLPFSVTGGAGQLSIFPTELNFTGRSGAPPPDPANISVWNNGVPIPFHVTATASWLSVNSGAGQTNQGFAVAASPSGIGAGTYISELQIVADGAPNLTRKVPVSFFLAPAADPKLEIAPVRQIVELASGTSAKYQLIVSNPVGGKMSFFTQTSGESWLSLQTTYGTATPARPSSLNYTLDATGVAPGIYNATITVSDVDSTQRASAAITFVVSDRKPTVAVSQSAVAFTMTPQQPASKPKSFTIRNQGLAAISVAIDSEMVSEGASWLTVTSAASVLDPGASAIVNVVADPHGLAPGRYFGFIRIRAGFESGSVQSIPVALNVKDPSTPMGGRIGPAGVYLTGNLGSSAGAKTKVLLSNPTANPVTFSSVPGADWLSLTPSSGSIAAFQTLEAEVAVNLSKGVAGVRSDVIRIPFNDGIIGTVNVLAYVAPAALAASVCVPSSLAVQITSLEPGFAATAGDMTAIQARILDNCGIAPQTGVVVARLSDDPNPLTLFYESQGLWTASWSPRKARPAIQVTVAAGSGEGTSRITGQATVSGTVDVAFSTAPPLADSIVNMASFQSPGQIAPGSRVVITGDGLANDAADSPEQPYPSELAGVSVTLGGIRLPIISVLPNQVNALVPLDTEPNTLQQLVVRRGSILSMPINVQVAKATPAIFSVDKTGAGQGSILIAGSNVLAANAPAGRPAKSGDILQILCTGLGMVSNPPREGQSIAQGAQAPTVDPVQVTVAGVRLPAIYAGLAPELPGLYLVTVKVTDDVPGGLAPVTISMAGKESNSVTIQIQ